MSRHIRVLAMLTIVLFSLSHFSDITVLAKSDHLALTGERKDDQDVRVANRDLIQDSNQKQINLLLLVSGVTMITAFCSCNFVGMGVAGISVLALCEWQDRNNLEYCNGGCGNLMFAMDSNHKVTCNNNAHVAHQWWSCGEGSSCPHKSDHHLYCETAVRYVGNAYIFGCGSHYLPSHSSFHASNYCNYCHRWYRECTPGYCIASNSGHSNPPVIPLPPRASTVTTNSGASTCVYCSGTAPCKVCGTDLTPNCSDCIDASSSCPNVNDH